MAETNCRHFSGYKPCGLNETCNSHCPHRDIPGQRILVVHLEALGAVLRATSLLPALKRKYPSSHITWVTQAPAHQFFRENPLVDRVLTTTTADLLSLSSLSFDVAFCVDKSLKAAGVLKTTRYDDLFGFKVESRTGSILPATSAAEELWELGLSNYRKFFVNKKPETQLMIEALELGPYQRDPYQVHLANSEVALVDERRVRWSPLGLPLIGVNTGCSGVIPYKKLSISYQIELIHRIQTNLELPVVLLGGPEDEERNQEIARQTGAIQSPCQSGLRDGLVSVAACDLVISGDSLGMHMAIALNKWTVAWFGPTCAHEIELYDRGVAILSQVGCSPCWKRECSKAVMCYDMVAMEDVINGLHQGLQWLRTFSLSKLPTSATSFSPSPSLRGFEII